MKTRVFSFDIPKELIAQYPSERRDDCRLLALHGPEGGISHHTMADFPELLVPGSLLILNDSRVRKARLFGVGETGGKVEFLLLATKDRITWRVVCSKSSRQKLGRRYRFPAGLQAVIKSVHGEERQLAFSRPVTESYLDEYGHVPLPPYIRREDEESDSESYQTVYSRNVGSAAAPTAGLHFTEELLDALRDRGIGIAFVTLHVGLGTFMPIRTENIEEHSMHSEWYTVPSETVTAYGHARNSNKPVIAVGTTTVRTLESAHAGDTLRSGSGTTRLYITPGYAFKCVDGLLTNFHTPGSSLLVMVSAFAGIENIRRAYEEAITARYRFFSYGDAMVIFR
jgi:S-adenosylmethionine:tRNA ribosyltransferase-isomerase